MARYIHKVNIQVAVVFEGPEADFDKTSKHYFSAEAERVVRAHLPAEVMAAATSFAADYGITGSRFMYDEENDKPIPEDWSRVPFVITTASLRASDPDYGVE